MNDEDRSLLSRAVDALRGHNADPVRAGLQQLIAEHGREAVIKAAADEQVTPPGDELDGLTQEDIDALLAESESQGGGESGDEEPPAWAKGIVDRLDKLEGKASTAEGDKLPEDELALVKAGVPIEQIEAMRPILRSQDEQARKAGFETLAKQAKVGPVAAQNGTAGLLAKEGGSSEIPPVGDLDAIPEAHRAWARGDDLHPSQGIDQLAKQLAAAIAKGGGSK